MLASELRDKLGGPKTRPTFWQWMFSGTILKRAGWTHCVGYLWRDPGGRYMHRDEALLWELESQRFGRELAQRVTNHFAGMTDGELARTIEKYRAAGLLTDSPNERAG